MTSNNLMMTLSDLFLADHPGLELRHKYWSSDYPQNPTGSWRRFYESLLRKTKDRRPHMTLTSIPINIADYLCPPSVFVSLNEGKNIQKFSKNSKISKISIFFF